MGHRNQEHIAVDIPDEAHIHAAADLQLVLDSVPCRFDSRSDFSTGTCAVVEERNGPVLVDTATYLGRHSYTHDNRLCHRTPAGPHIRQGSPIPESQTGLRMAGTAYHTVRDRISLL